jgi:DNA-binding transcriptional LysR family regulator
MERMRRIELLVRAAEAGSFAKAARLLQLDPSVVSRAIAELEKELRVTLFYRTTRHLRLTEYGEEICRRGSEILQRLADLENAASKAPEVLTGTLRVGLGTSMGESVIMPRLYEFMRRHPGLRIECLLQTQIKDMHASGVDLLLRAGDPPDSGVIARKLSEVKLGVYAAPKYLESAGEPATPQDILRHRCVIYVSPHLMNKPWNEWEFERNGERKLVKAPSTLVTDEREGLIAAAVAGCGLVRIGLFDPALITSGRLRKVLKDWNCPGGPAHYAIYRKTLRMPAKIAAFLDFVTEALAAFDPDELTITRSAKFGGRGKGVRD